MSEERIILPDSVDVAHFQGVVGWVSREGRFYGFDTISKGGKHYLIRVNFYPPKADVIFLFKDEEDRDRAFSDAQQEAT
jgi:hypothetical protein